MAFATGVGSLATLFSYGGRWSSACELLVNLRTHFAMLLGLALPLALVARHSHIAGVAASGLALNLWAMIDMFPDSVPSFAT